MTKNKDKNSINKKYSRESTDSKIAAIVALIITASLITIFILGSKATYESSLMGNTNKESLEGSNKVPIDTSVEFSDEEIEQVRKMLEENGVDPSIIEEATKTETGGTLLGSAKPVKQFKTLAEAEEYYDDYFGFHNTIDSLPGYSLVGMYSIYDQFIQGIYETDNGEHIYTVKFSKTMSSEELREVYNDYTFVTIVNYDDQIKYACEGPENDKINLIRFDFPNGKSYTVYSAEAFDVETADSIAAELIENLKSMDDWENEW